MKKADEIKEKIMEVTTELINSSNGNIEIITSRAIAKSAGIGVGLINYHFRTKENLIEICIQKMIESVILQFSPDIKDTTSPIDKLKITAKSVSDFLIHNPALSRISILSDYKNPNIFDNTMKTVQGFSYAIGEIDIPKDKKRQFLFVLTSTLQQLFLRKDMSMELFGFDYRKKEERDQFIDFIVEKLFREVIL